MSSFRIFVIGGSFRVVFLFFFRYLIFLGEVRSWRFIVRGVAVGELVGVFLGFSNRY